jgi:hypothetical protein
VFLGMPIADTFAAPFVKFRGHKPKDKDSSVFQLFL